MKEQLRPMRVFSDALKKKIVKDIESAKSSISAIGRHHGVSTTTLYRWLNKYSRNLHSGQKLVMQMDSEAYKTKELERRIMELEAALGRKQLEVDFLNQVFEQGKKELGIDLKKKFFTPPFNGSGSTKDSTTTQ